MGRHRGRRSHLVQNDVEVRHFVHGQALLLLHVPHLDTRASEGRCPLRAVAASHTRRRSRGAAAPGVQLDGGARLAALALHSPVQSSLRLARSSRPRTVRRQTKTIDRVEVGRFVFCAMRSWTRRKVSTEDTGTTPTCFGGPPVSSSKSSGYGVAKVSILRAAARVHAVSLSHEAEGAQRTQHSAPQRTLYGREESRPQGPLLGCKPARRASGNEGAVPEGATCWRHSSAPARSERNV